MDSLYETLYILLNAELDDLAMGHGYDKERVSYMRSIMSILFYLDFAILDNSDVLKILQTYEHI